MCARRVARHWLLRRASQQLKDAVVYTFVDPKAVASIKKHGLLSGDEIAKHPKLLSLARPDPADRKKWLKTYRELSQDPKEAVIFKGPSVFFSMPDLSKLDAKHPIKQRGLVPVKVNLGDLLHDHPNLLVYGVELKPYQEGMTDAEFASREKVLDPSELKKLLNASPITLWKHYDPKDAEHYASDVPHAFLLTKKIPPRYLDFPEG